MSAVVCGKRSSSFFEEPAHITPPPVSKRARCCSPGGASFSSFPTAILRLSPDRASPCFDRNEGGNSADHNLFAAHLAHLRSMFPQTGPQLLQRALKESGDDLDSAIKFLNDLQIESIQISLGSVGNKTEAGFETNAQLPTEGIAAVPIQSAAECPPRNSSEWGELLVIEMMNASDMNDAKSRASQMVEVVQKSTLAHVAEVLESSRKENVTLKEKFQVVLGENNVLKRAVSILHDRQKDYDAMSQEVQHLKPLVSQREEQIRALEMNNFALAMHLKEAQHSNSIPGRFNPDVF